MSSEAVSEMVQYSMPQSNSCYDKSNLNMRRSEYVFESDMSCYVCKEVVDNVERFLKYPCRCGCKICTWCWPQTLNNYGGSCPACFDHSQQNFPEPNFVVGYPAQYDKSTQNTSRSRRSTIDFDRRDFDENMSHSYNSESTCTDMSPPRLMNNPYPVVKTRSLSFSNIQLPTTHTKAQTRKTMQNLRVIQRNLVYVIGLSPKITATEAASPPYFGQYGRIVKIVMNHHHGVSEDDPRHGSASAYVTFQFKEDAWSAIKAVDGFWLEDRHVRASFGTTKYCNSFLRNVVCDNPDCLYLHEYGDERDRFTKEEIQAGLARHGSSFAFRDEFNGNGSTFDRPSGTGTYSPCPILPPAPPAVEARTIYRSQVAESGCVCCTPKQTLQRHPSGGRLDWSPRRNHPSDVFTQMDRPGTVPSRARLPGLPPLQRPSDIHSQNKFILPPNASPLGIISGGILETDKGQGLLPPASKDSVYSSRSNSTLSTRSMSDNSIGKITYNVDCLTVKKPVISDNGPTSLGDSSAGNSLAASPCGPTGCLPGLGSIWSVSLEKTSTNNPASASSAMSTKPPSISGSPLRRRLSHGFGSFTWQSPASSRDTNNPWGSTNLSAPNWTTSLQSPQAYFNRPDDHFRSQSWSLNEDPTGLPPPHPNRPSALSFHQSETGTQNDSFFSGLCNKWDFKHSSFSSFKFQTKKNEHEVSVDGVTDVLSGMNFLDSADIEKNTFNSYNSNSQSPIEKGQDENTRLSVTSI